MLTAIAAIIAFALAGTAFAEETYEGLTAQPLEAEEPDLPVGGWAPAEPIYVPTDLVVNGTDSSGKVQSAQNVINADPYAVFTKGASQNGYNALTAGQKKIYDAIDTVAIGFLNAGKDLQPTAVTVDGKAVNQYIVGAVDYSKMGIEGATVEARKQNALKAFYAYDYDHPAYYWISDEVLYNEKCVYPCTEKEYAGIGVRQELNLLVSCSVKAYADLAATGTDSLDKFVLVHDKIVNDIDYAYDSDGTTPNPARWAHSVHGVFDPVHKKAVCEGYADAFALIMNYLGIRNYYIVGDAGTDGPGGGSGHAWNAVYDDAADRYLYMDLTWDDCGDKGYSYAYFGMPMSNFEQSHHEYTSDAAEGKKWLYNIDGDYNDGFGGTFYNRGGYYFDKNEKEANAFVAAAKEKAARGGGWVSILCSDEDSLKEIATALGIENAYYVVTYKAGDSDYNFGYLIAKLDGSHNHAWTNPEYAWLSDGSKVSAVRICGEPNCDLMAEIETVKTTSKITKAATYTAKGQRTYTAVFQGAEFTTQTKTLTDVPMLVKKANTMKVKATTQRLKAKKLKKKALTVTPLKVTYAKGTVTYKLVSGNAKSKKALKLNTKTGKVTVKKKAKKGTYKIRVKVTAAGTTVYKALSKTVYVTVRVK